MVGTVLYNLTMLNTTTQSEWEKWTEVDDLTDYNACVGGVEIKFINLSTKNLTDIRLEGIKSTSLATSNGYMNCLIRCDYIIDITQISSKFRKVNLEIGRISFVGVRILKHKFCRRLLN